MLKLRLRRGPLCVHADKSLLLLAHAGEVGLTNEAMHAEHHVDDLGNLEVAGGAEVSVCGGASRVRLDT